MAPSTSTHTKIRKLSKTSTTLVLTYTKHSCDLEITCINELIVILK